MTKTRLSLIAAGAILMLGGAACNSTGGLGGSTPTPTKVAQCPIGNWRSTQVEASASAAGAAVTAQGGSGVKMTIDEDGAVHANFSGMQPIDIAAQAGGVQVKGDIRYGNTVDGKVDLSGTATATGSASSSGRS